ncbi:hypothetical protein N9A86_02840 [Akkermansiaceae bacterium]|nr:hypothetical protein [Akkermansiaceae bacterium]
MTSRGDFPESVAEDMMGVMKEVTQIVKGVNGGDDASEAIDDIKGLKGELKEIADRAKKILGFKLEVRGLV